MGAQSISDLEGTEPFSSLVAFKVGNHRPFGLLEGASGGLPIVNCFGKDLSSLENSFTLLATLCIVVLTNISF